MSKFSSFLGIQCTQWSKCAERGGTAFIFSVCIVPSPLWSTFAKISKIVDNRCQILRLNAPNSLTLYPRCCWKSPDPYSCTYGPTSKKRRKGGEGIGKRRQDKRRVWKEEGKSNSTLKYSSPTSSILL